MPISGVGVAPRAPLKSAPIVCGCILKHESSVFYFCCTSLFQEMVNKKAQEAEQQQVQESSVSVSVQEHSTDVEKTKCEEEQIDKSQSRGS